MGKKIGEEITQKIKSAVKAKLIELGIEVDNELPDYIMVLVANKKTQAQMEHDLQLFLGANTMLFTTWLINVLKKLEEVTVSKKNYKRIEVTSHDGGVLVTKKEEDYDNRRAMRLAAKVKLEPGTSQVNSGSVIQETGVPQEHNLDKEERPEVEEAHNEESNSSDGGETETNSNDALEEEEDEVSKTVEQTYDTEPLSHDEYSLDKPSEHLEESDEVVLDKDQGGGTDDDEASETLETRERDESLEKDELSDSSRPKETYNINEQIGKVMEKTINGNKKPRRDSDKFIDDDEDVVEMRFNERKDSLNDNPSSYDKKRPIENEFYRGAEKLDDNYHRSPDRYRSASGRSPDNNRFRDTRRSPYNDRFRDSGRRSPYNERFRDSGRRSYDNDRSNNLRRSPNNRRRNYYDDRRSPEFRRRSPISRRRGADYERSQDFRRRSPINKQRSFEDRRLSPLNRRRSPIGRRRSPIDRRRQINDRRLYSDRDEFDNTSNIRTTSLVNVKSKILDAREILKRKNNRLQNLPSDNNLSDEELPKKRKGLVSMVQKLENNREREKSLEPQIPSLVKVTPRPLRNEAIQPNKKLLLIAVADAEKSITRKSSFTQKEDEANVKTELPDSSGSEHNEDQPPRITHRAALLSIKKIKDYFIQQGNRSDSEFDLLKNWMDEILVEMYEALENS